VSSIACQYAKKKFKFAEKCKNYRQATILINRILVELKSHIREPTCDKARITEQLKIYDDILLDTVKIPSIHKYEKMYNTEFVD
jgi:predicted nucleic acid-binding protein